MKSLENLSHCSHCSHLKGPAERADVIVDFSGFSGKTLILYNDAPAPFPASDPRQDYFTGNADQSDTGGAPATLPGYGPNTRTIMQIRVAGTPGGTAPIDYYSPATLAALQTVLPAAFKVSQDTIIVPQAPYNSAYNPTTPFPGDASAYVKIQDNFFTFTPVGSTTPVTLPLEPTTIQDEMGEAFDPEYGRMGGKLGVEMPKTTALQQTMMLYGYVDPPTEVVKFSDIQMTPIGTLGDGTQLWKITHNGVDTHAMHFHMFSIQLVNRVAWDNNIRVPDANELGWKDTVRVNPLQDTIVALRPIKLTNVPFPLPNSIRPLDVTKPIGSSMGFTNKDPLGNPVTVTNELTNFGWEYVWHCHLLGHEENDMMRPMIFQVAPPAPSNLVATPTIPVDLTWTDNSASETAWVVERDTDPLFPAPVLVNIPSTTTIPYGGTISYTDTTAALGMTYYYRVQAVDDFTPYSPLPAPWNPVPISSAWSNTVTVILVPKASLVPTVLSFGNQALGTTSAPKPVSLTNSGLAPLSITSITTSGSYAQTNNCVSPLAAAASCTINVTFTPPPTVAGGQSGTLTIVDNAAGSPHTVALSGVGVGPVAVLSSTSLVFATQRVGTTSAPKLVNLSNIGNAAMTISSITASGNFAQTNNCPSSLAGRSYCTLSVTFTPTATGTRTGAITIVDNAAGSPQTVALSGTGQ